MKFVLKPSLGHMALVKIATSLWNQSDVWALISKLCYMSEPMGHRAWKTIEERVIRKVPHLSLPQLLKEKVLGSIKPIGLEVLEWIRFHRRYLPAPIAAELYWTPEGTVDRKRTGEVLVRDENLDMSTRYKLACIYCMEDDIILFWNNMTEDLRESASYRPEIIFWSQIMRRESHISYKDEFRKCAGVWGNNVAAEYFLQKLTPMERKESLIETAKGVLRADTLCVLISKMDEEQQMEVFRHKPYGVLLSFLEWPWQSFFIEIASCMWDFLSKKDYNDILKNISNKVRVGYKDCNYQMLFREFWQKSPNALKSLITNEIHTSWLSLCHIKDKENIRLILKDTSLTAKEELIYSGDMYSFCRDSIRDTEWDFLEFCIRECFPSKNEMLKFKKEFEKHIYTYFKDHFAIKKPKWDLLFNFSDDFICKCDESSLEEGESSSSK